MPTNEAPKRPNNPMGRSFLLSLAGAFAGWFALCVLAAAIFGAGGVLLLLFTPYFAVLVAASLIALALTTIVTRLWPRRLRGGAIVLIAAILTVALFAIVPIRIYLNNPDGFSGPMFG